MNSNILKKQILIIEDDVTFSNMLKIRLELNGYEAITAKDGLQGFEVAINIIPDLIILDLMLPETTQPNNSFIVQLDKNYGHKVCRMIKFNQSTAHIPVLILTCSDSDTDVDLAKNCGADAYVLKTTKTEMILDIINKLINRVTAK